MNDEPSGSDESEVMEVIGNAVVKAGNAVNPLSDEGLRSRLFGPLFDVWGARLGEWADRRRTNAEAITASAVRMTDDDDGLQPNMRTTAEIIEVGSWSESAVSQAYLGGLFAGSRSADGSDDSGLPWAKLTNALSSAEISLHYVVYRCICRQAPAFGLDLENEVSSEHNFWEHRVVISPKYFESLTGVGEGSVQPVVLGLRRVGLIGQVYRIDDEGSITVSPTQAGAELYARGHGRSLSSSADLLTLETALNPALDELVADIDSEITGELPEFIPRHGAKLVERERT